MQQANLGRFVTFTAIDPKGEHHEWNCLAGFIVEVAAGSLAASMSPGVTPSQAHQGAALSLFNGHTVVVTDTPQEVLRVIAEARAEAD